MLSGKKVFIAPPEYFPKLAYLSMIKVADVFLMADTFQYSRQSYQNRCKVRSADGWHWLTVPVVGRQHGKPVLETMIDDRVAWPGKHIRAIRYNYRSSPYYDYYAPRIKPVWENVPISLGELTAMSVTLVHDFFELETPVIHTSELPIEVGRLSDLKNHLADAVVITTPDLYDYYAYLFANVMVYSFSDIPYWQNFDGFIPGLSSLHALFNLGPAATTLLQAKQSF